MKQIFTVIDCEVDPPSYAVICTEPNGYSIVKYYSNSIEAQHVAQLLNEILDKH